MKKCGDVLKNLRLNSGLTQEELGRELGFDRSVISRLENNLIQPSIEQLELYSNYFNISLEEILNKDNSKVLGINNFYAQYLTIVLASIIGMALSPYGIIICLICTAFAIKRKMLVIVIVFAIFFFFFCLEDFLFLCGIDLFPGIIKIR